MCVCVSVCVSVCGDDEICDLLPVQVHSPITLSTQPLLPLFSLSSPSLLPLFSLSCISRQPLIGDEDGNGGDAGLDPIEEIRF